MTLRGESANLLSVGAIAFGLMKVWQRSIQGDLLAKNITRGVIILIFGSKRTACSRGLARVMLGFAHNAASAIARRRPVSRLPCPHRGHYPSLNRDNNRSNLKLEIEYIHV
jgi:hypothetical protein